MTLISTKLLSEAQQELLLNTGIGIVSYDALRVEKLPVLTAEMNTKFIIITSSNAISALATLEKEAHHLLCVGSKTVTKLQQLGFQVLYSAQHARDLAQYIIKNHKGNDTYTYICGEQRLDELPAALLAAQIDFKEVKVYRTVMVERAYRRIFDAVLCYSPRGVHAFAKANPKQTNCAICIGETTATAARLFFKKVVVATVPTVENTLITAYKTLRHD